MPDDLSEEQKQGFFDLVEAFEQQEVVQQEERQARPSRARSLASAPARGAARTARSAFEELTDFLGGIVSPIGLGGLFEQAKAGAMIPREQFEAGLEEQLPVESAFPERALERAGEIGPLFLGSGMGLPAVALRSLLMGGAGQTAEELGVGPFGQAAAELAAGALPSLSRQIVSPLRPSAREVEVPLVEGARRLGLTEEQIAPLLPKPGKQAAFKLLGKRTAKTTRAIEKTGEGLGTAFESIRQRPVAQVNIPKINATGLRVEMESIMRDLPQGFRQAVVEDVGILFDGGVTGEKVISFWQKINKLPANQRDSIARLKDPLRNVLNSIDPALAQDFTIANELFARFAKTRATLTRDMFDNFIDAGEVVEGLRHLISGDFTGVAATVGIDMARRVGSEFVINPRLQNISARMVKALKNNKFAVANRLMNEIADELRDVDPDFANQLLSAEFSADPSKQKRARRPVVPLTDEEIEQAFGGAQ